MVLKIARTKTRGRVRTVVRRIRSVARKRPQKISLMIGGALASPFVYGFIEKDHAIDLTYTKAGATQPTTTRVNAGAARFLYESMLKLTGISMVTGQYSFQDQAPFLKALGVGIVVNRVAKVAKIDKKLDAMNLPFTI